MRRCNGMAGGVLLAAALVHLLPDAQKVRGEACEAAAPAFGETFFFKVMVLVQFGPGDFCYVYK